MSLAKLNIIITRWSDACHIEDREPYFVHITDCIGQPLVWCNKTYTFLETKCGHLQVEIPPGCYTVFAGHNPRTPREPELQPFGNLLTHVQVVRVNCGDHVCVTLFAPGMWHCGTWFERALRTQIPALEKNKIDTTLAREAATAVGKFLAKLAPEPYTTNVMRAIDKGPPKK